MRKRVWAAAIAGCLTAALAVQAQGLEGRTGKGMWVIAHRGAPVYTAEASPGGYQRAADLGADQLEGDLVISQDGVVVVSHDVELSRVTNVATKPQFASYRDTRTINGVPYSGWWVDDFTWAELQQLTTPDGQPLMTLDQLLDFTGARGLTASIEIKDSDYFAGRQTPTENFDIVQAVINRLAARGLTARQSPVWIQSSSENDLRRLRSAVANRLVYVTYGVQIEDVGQFGTYRQFADVLAVPTTRVRRQLVQQAHAADLAVHVWTLRGSRDAYRKAAAVGADGVFTDFPDLAVDVRDRLRVGPRPEGLTTRVENGTAIAAWAPRAPGTRYAVTFDFGDPLLAPTIWTTNAAASLPMAGSKSVKVSVAAFDGTRLSEDATAYAYPPTAVYDAPAVPTRVTDVSTQIRSDAQTVIRGRFEVLATQKKKSTWRPLRRATGWIRVRGDEFPSLHKKVTSDKKGEFAVWVRVRDDILSGYVPARSYRIGVTQTPKLRSSSSGWVRAAGADVPEPTGDPRKRRMPRAEVRISTG